jgi:hypothetical protein
MSGMFLSVKEMRIGIIVFKRLGRASLSLEHKAAMLKVWLWYQS